MHFAKHKTTLASLADEASLFRMDCITNWGRKFLPPGYWGENGHQSSTRVCLTFDDGPDPHTTEFLLEALAELDVTATFFLLGSHVARYPNLVEKIVQAGHEVGNHSYNHHFLPVLSTRMLEAEVDTTNKLIAEITSQEVKLFRPPYGIIDRRAADCLKERNMLPIYWGAVSEDWGMPGSQSVVNRVMRRLPAGNLIVLHERKLLSKQTIAASRGIIEQSRALGYEFVSVSNLMQSACES